MSELIKICDADAVRDDFVPKDGYFSPHWQQLEADHLWPRVWQIACRLEELESIGDYVTYDLLDDSLIVVRTDADEIKAYYNACPHRGRRLTSGDGNVKTFVCRYHGWKFGLDGDNQYIQDREDWGSSLTDADVKLQSVHVAVWGGWVFINMAENPERFDEFIAPFPEVFKNFEFEKLRTRWVKTVRLDCNWKTVVEAFNEGYHVARTHPQLLPFFNDYSVSAAHGRHGTFWYPMGDPVLQQSTRLKSPPSPDNRSYILGHVDHFETELMAMITPRRTEAARELMKEMPADTDPLDLVMRWDQLTRAAAERDGAGWPPVTPEDMQKANVDWHMFPNCVFLAGYVDGVLWYRARPDGDNPNSCIFDIWSLVRYAPGAEPVVQKEYYNNWRDHDGWGLILKQDFRNLEEVQRGMRVRGFKGSRTNPVQERPISNFHKALRTYIEEGRLAPQTKR